MEFDGQYLTYQEYQDLGGSLEETPFNLLEYEARKQIDIRTQRRLVEAEEIPAGVKLCDFHLIQKIGKYAEAINEVKGSKKSESTDGYSVTFATTSDITEMLNSKQNEIDDIVTAELYGIIVNNEHLIYLGVK